MSKDNEAVPAILFEEEAVKTARLFGRNGEVNVVFAGNQAHTDGNTITLPMLDHGSDIDATSIQVARGYVDHEAGEILYIDQGLAKTLRNGNKHDPLLVTTFNAIGDALVEHCVRDVYPGAEKNLLATAERVADHFMATEAKKAPTWKDEIESITPLAFTWGFREQEGYAGLSVRDCYAQVNPRIRGLIKKYIGIVQSELYGLAGDKTKATMKAFDIARAMVGEIRAGDPPIPPEEEGQRRTHVVGKGGKGGKGGRSLPSGLKGGDKIKSGKSGKGEKGEGESKEAAPGAGEGEPEKKEEEKPKAPKEQEPRESAAPVSDTEKGAHDVQRPEEDHDFGEGEIDIEGDYEVTETEGLDDEIDRAGGTSMPGIGSGGKMQSRDFRVLRNNRGPFNIEVPQEAFVPKKSNVGKYRPLTTSFDMLHHYTDAGKGKVESVLGQTVSYNGGDVLAMKEGTANYNSIHGSASGPIAVMKRKLERALAAKMARSWVGRLEDGRLDSRDLVRAFKAKPNVFKQREEAVDLDTAVQIVIDLSGSMSGSKTVLTNQAAVMFAEALERTGVEYEIIGFNSMHINDGAAQYIRAAREDDQKWSRWQPLDMWLFKGFDDSLRFCRTSIGNLHHAVGGDNADGDSLLFAWRRLSRRLKKRKVMIVLSDGYPATQSSYPEQLGPHLRYAIDVIQRSGIDVVGIGIKSEAVKQFYPKYVVVHDIQELPGAIMDKVARALLGDRFIVDNSKLLKVERM